MEGCVRLQADAPDCRIKLLEPSRRADKRAAGAERRDKMRDPAGGLLPNLVGGGSIVGLPVRGIAVLVRVKILLGICGDYFVLFANCSFGAFFAGSDCQYI